MLYGKGLRPVFRGASGFTLVETLVALVILGAGLAAVLNVMTRTVEIHSENAERVRALGLAWQLVTEIEMQAFEEPAGAVSFGPESGEQGATRGAFDDVDDYANWSESPPVDRNGVPLPGGEGLTRRVAVQNVNEWLLENSAPNGTTGAKRVTVRVVRDGRVLAELSILRMRGASEKDYQ